ncbi:MAG: hypothetical protein ACXV3S_10315, partial [Kineosporiaceae bacterium]
ECREAGRLPVADLLQDAPGVLELAAAHGRRRDEEVLVGVDDPQRASRPGAEDGDDLRLGGSGRARPRPVQYPTDGM